MSLLEEFKARSKTGDWPDHDDVALELDAEEVNYDILDTTRWGEMVQFVYRRGDEYVSITYERASGDGDTVYYPTFTEVKPVEVTVVQYKPVA